MTSLVEPLRTSRLLLRRWRREDRAPFAALNADPRVMQHFPGVLVRAESDALAARIERHFERHGFGLWVVEIPGVAPFAGYVGLAVPTFEAAFTPCVEVGWRLARAWWRLGYATEAARAAVAFGFEALRLAEIVSFTVPENAASRRVMEKLGMTRDPADDFDHPSLPAGHRLLGHVLYRLRPSTGPTGYYGKPQIENEQPSLTADVCVIFPSSEQVHCGGMVVSQKTSLRCPFVDW